MKYLASLVFSILVFSSVGYAQQIDPVCLRLEGLHLPCLSGGHGSLPPPTCNGQTLSDKASCDAMLCDVPVPVDGVVAKNERGECKEYSYQCSGEYQGDGCRATCQLVGNRCQVQNTCGSLPPGFQCQLSTGNCKEYEYSCREQQATCYNDKTQEAGHAEYDESTNCCRCPTNRIPRCTTC